MSSTQKIKSAKFIPYEPTKAATGPSTSTPINRKNIRRYTKKVDSTRVNPKRPDNLICYPKPYTFVHAERKNDEKLLEEASISEILTPENTPSVERRLVIQDVESLTKSEQSVKISSSSSKRELFAVNDQSSKNSEAATSLQNVVVIAQDPKAKVSALEISNSRPVNKVDPFISKDLAEAEMTTIDISELEMHEIDRLRRLNKTYLKQIEDLNHERNEFKSELDAQFKVNTELKKLLVASVGEDLQHRVERIIREKAHMTNEIGDYHRRISTDVENLDKVSIQADMWRSKYLASRVMVDELARWKATLSIRYKEIQKALDDLLKERQQLQSNLIHTYRHLQLVKDAFLPNPVKVHPLQSQTVDNLGKMNSKLAADLKQQLLGNIQSINDVHLVINGDKLTAAEQHAQLILISPQFQLDQNEPEIQSMTRQGFRPIERYHPDARYEHVTVNCCKNCNGDIYVV